MSSTVKRVLAALLAGLAVLLLWSLSQTPPAEPPPPDPPDPKPVTPQPQPKPAPCPPDKPCPRPRHWTPLAPLQASVGGPVAPDGTEAQCDLPPELHLKNRGGSDGSGLCVFASMTHSGRWQNDPAFSAVFEWMWSHPGGGYPEKVDRVVEQMCREKSLPKPSYLQVEGGDVEILRTACRNGLMPGVTYSFSPSGRYGGQRIAHMVSLVHADERWFGILDNNYPGTVEWLTPDEFRRSYTGGGGGWAVILMKEGPPPVPHPSKGDER
jgi:hypothetical protein